MCYLHFNSTAKLFKIKNAACEIESKLWVEYIKNLWICECKERIHTVNPPLRARKPWVNDPSAHPPRYWSLSCSQTYSGPPTLPTIRTIYPAEFWRKALIEWTRVRVSNNWRRIFGFKQSDADTHKGGFWTTKELNEKVFRQCIIYLSFQNDLQSKKNEGFSLFFFFALNYSASLPFSPEIAQNVEYPLCHTLLPPTLQTAFMLKLNYLVSQPMISSFILGSFRTKNSWWILSILVHLCSSFRKSCPIFTYTI